MTRPRVICHMLASVDGRIVTERLAALDGGGTRSTRRCTRSYDARRMDLRARDDGAALRRGHAVRRRRWRAIHDGPSRDDFLAPGDHASFAIAVDPRGKLVWESGEVAGDHVVAVLSERVSDDYLATLRERGVSYLLAGRDDIDLAVALEKIGARLGVRTLMLEGGGGINGSFLRAGLIDEVSLLVAPVADGRIGTPTLFDVAGEDAVPWRLALESVERRAGDVLWLRYRVEPRAEGT